MICALLATGANADNARAEAPEKNDWEGVYTEFGVRNRSNTIPGVMTGVIGIVHEDLRSGASIRGGFSFYTTDEKADLLTGAELGMRLHLRSTVAPFFGIGGFACSSEEKVRADDDGVDNDEDGIIDEAGETKNQTKDFIAGIYPEVGVQVWLSRNVGLNASLKYHITTEGRKFYYWISAVGMYMQF
jgi:hypothetical protein